MFRSKLFATYFTLSAFEVCCAWFLWWFSRDALPARVPFNFLERWGEGQLVLSSTLWQVPLFMTTGLGLASLCAFYYWKREKIYGQFLITSITFVNFIALMSFVRVIVRFT